MGACVFLRDFIFWLLLDVILAPTELTLLVQSQDINPGMYLHMHIDSSASMNQPSYQESWLNKLCSQSFLVSHICSFVILK